MKIEIIFNFISKRLVLIIFLILLFVPFFWFNHGELDLGGDSSRLYFLDPISFIKNVSLYSIIPLNAMGQSLSLFYLIPFSSLLFIIKVVLFNSSYLLNCLFYSFVLAGGFLFFYLSIKELFAKDKNEISLIEKVSFILAGLFFVLSPIICEFQNALLSTNQTVIYPLFFYLFLKFLGNKDYKYVFYLVFICFLFSVNFSVNVIPWFLAFFVFVGIFMFFYAQIEKKGLILLKGVALFFILFLLTQFFQLIPQIYGLIDPANGYNQMLSSKVNNGLQYFESIRPYVQIIYNLGNQYQSGVLRAYHLVSLMQATENGVKYLFLFLIYPILVVLGVFNLKKIKEIKTAKKYSLVFAMFVILLFFMTANIGSLGVDLYRKFFDLPGFSMFRSYYSKFNFVFTFFYSLLFGYSLVIVFKTIKLKSLKLMLSLIIFCLIIFNAWPLLSGKVMNAYRSGTGEVKPILKMDGNYIKFLDFIKNKKIDAKYLSFPLSDEQYTVIKGESGGAYVGNSMIGAISGKNDFVGLGSFSIFKGSFLKILRDNNNKELIGINSVLNIGYIVHNSDTYIYDNFGYPSIGHPYTKEFLDIFPNQQSISRFISKLNFSKDFKIGSYNLYSAMNSFLPHFYTPQTLITTQQNIDTLPEIVSQKDYNIRSAIYFGNNQITTIVIPLATSSETFNPNELKKETINNTPVVEFKKINPTKYRVIIHHARDNFPLVFSDYFNDGWKTYLVDDKKTALNFNPADYKILDGNFDDQASPEELTKLINSGYISTLGNLKEKKIKHVKWENNREAFDYNENYKIDFISKNFQDTIQNDNLVSGNFYETWFKYPVDDNRNHLLINGYANSWNINPNELCLNNAKCVKNADGSYDLELVIEFWPQRLFYIGLFISGMTLLGCLGYLGWGIIRKKREVEIVKN